MSAIAAYQLFTGGLAITTYLVFCWNRHLWDVPPEWIPSKFFTWCLHIYSPFNPPFLLFLTPDATWTRNIR